MTKNLDQLLNSRLSLNNMGDKDIRTRAQEFQKLIQLTSELEAYPYFQALDDNQGAEAVLNGQRVIMMGSNNYLGLTTHPKVREAAIKAIETYGTSMTGSRLLNGTLSLHEEFEEEIADFLGKEAALIFTTGYQVNIGTITALTDPNTTVFLDKLNHASMWDAVSMSAARPVFYKHLDAESLGKSLEKTPADRQKIVVTDGIFSMEGDIAPLPEIVKVCQKHKALLIVDDAHAIGTLGPRGEGAAGHFGLSKEVDLITATFSKALASTGGYVAGDSDLINYIKHFGRSMIFSASITPSNLAAARAAFHILQEEPERVRQVQKNAEKLKNGLVEMGWDVGPSETPIIPIFLGDDLTTLTLWKELLNAGVYINPVVYPAVPPDKALLRISTIASHNDSHIQQALDAFQVVGERYHLLQKQASNALG
ncbi:MAG: pyridoxal phosphate-dependent aminotransferase family protein [Deltaproteobacteria bacterium]|nr:pyridoxal phosphate-dependent aminotransferase family protein [Deltaproteobacteria bacterium]